MVFYECSGTSFHGNLRVPSPMPPSTGKKALIRPSEGIIVVTLPETNAFCPQKETIVFQPSIFRCYVSFREGNNPMIMWVFPKIGGKPPKWMVKIMENPIKMDDLGVKTPIFGNTHVEIPYFLWKPQLIDRWPRWSFGHARVGSDVPPPSCAWPKHGRCGSGCGCTRSGSSSSSSSN